jgi:hypothetical protein
MNIEIILTAKETVYMDEGPGVSFYIMKGSHIDMDVTTK